MIALSLVSISLFSQERANSGLNKSIFGTQINIVGVNFYNECLIKEKTVLRSEISTSIASLWGGGFYPKVGYTILPSVKLAPRYYYNIVERKEKGKNIKNNAANFIDLSLIYTPNWFVISNYKDLEVYSAFFLIPNWGIRRNFSNSFNYEFNIGLGLGKSLATGSKINIVPSLGFKLGYDF